MLKSPVIVVGLPRTGTTFVARCLRDRYNVRMCLTGHVKPIEDGIKHEDTIEDKVIVGMNEKLFHKEISKNKYRSYMKEYFREMAKRWCSEIQA